MRCTQSNVFNTYLENFINVSNRLLSNSFLSKIKSKKSKVQIFKHCLHMGSSGLNYLFSKLNCMKMLLKEGM